MSEGGEKSGVRRIGSIPAFEAELLEASSDEAAVQETLALSSGLTDEPAARSMAVQETLQLNSGLSVSDLERDAAQKEHARSQKFRDNFELIAIAGLWTLFLALTLAAGIWFFHLITPAAWHWLNAGQLSSIQNIVTGGIIAAAIGDHFKRRLG